MLLTQKIMKQINHHRLGLLLTLTLIRINPVSMATTSLPTTAVPATTTMPGTTTTTISSSNTTTGMSQTMSTTIDRNQNATTTTSQMDNRTTITTPPTTTEKMYTFTEMEFNILIGVSVAIVVLLLILAAICGCWSGSQRRHQRRRREKRVTYYQPVEDDLPLYKDEEFYQPEIKNDVIGDIFIPYNGKPMAAVNNEPSPAHVPYNVQPSVVPYSPYLYDDRYGKRNGAFDRPYRSNLEVKAKRTDNGWMLSAPALNQDLPRVWI